MTTIFDLFGNQVELLDRKRGRPPHEATEKNINRVKMLVALGWSNQRIANALAVSLPTLRKNYFHELKGRDISRDQLEARRLELAWDLAEKGNIGAFKEFGKLMDRNDLMDAERKVGSSLRSEKQPTTQRLGKKVIDEQRALDADAELMAELEQEAIQHARH